MKNKILHELYQTDKGTKQWKFLMGQLYELHCMESDFELKKWQDVLRQGGMSDAEVNEHVYDRSWAYIQRILNEMGE